MATRGSKESNPASALERFPGSLDPLGTFAAGTEVCICLALIWEAVPQRAPLTPELHFTPAFNLLLLGLWGMCTVWWDGGSLESEVHGGVCVGGDGSVSTSMETTWW